MTARIAHYNSHIISSRSKKQRMARKARTACLEPNAGKASKGQPLEASTKLECKNVTDNSIFVEGLQNAGLSVVSQLSSSAKDPNQVVIVLQDEEDAHQIVNALNGCRLEDRTMHIKIASSATPVSKKKKKKQPKQKGPVPKLKEVRRCVSNAFHARAFKRDLARGGLQYAVAMQKARRNIKGPSAVAKKQKAKKGSTKEADVVEMEKSGPESTKSEGVGEQIYKQERGEEPGEMRDDSFRRETWATPQMKNGETQSDLRDERSHIQDTARMMMPTVSTNPDDILSALYESLI